MPRSVYMVWSPPGSGGGGTPLALYPAYDKGRILWTSGDFTEPALPQGTLTDVTANNDSQFVTACLAGSRRITIPSGVTLGDNSIQCANDLEIIVEGNITRFAVRKGQRIRIRGSTSPNKGYVQNLDMAPQGGTVSDIVVDGIKTTTGFGTIYNVQRFAFLNCVGKSASDSPIFLVQFGSTDWLVANCNFACPPRFDGNHNRNEWVCRIDNSDDGSSPSALQRVLWVDCTFQQYIQAWRYGSNVCQKIQLDRCTLVNIAEPSNVFYSDGFSGQTSDQVYLRNCTTVMSDASSPGNLALDRFGGVPAVGYTDLHCHAVDHAYIARATSVLTSAMLATIETAGNSHSPAESLRYRRSLADATATNGHTLTYDSSIESKWQADSSANAQWQTVTSALLGGTVGNNPHILAGPS